MKMTPRVKKGAWTKDEDALLLTCIKRHGEGKWHLVPIRAGLNRCRRSCRLRWMNYLRPNIKRGEFEEDEIDLIIRLHKLLGNKWSLIAGRIPGRTANHVKNYCNTRLGKEIMSEKEKLRNKPQKMIKVNVIKPHPRTFSKSSLWLSGKATLINCAAHGLNNDDNNNNNNSLADKSLSLPSKTKMGWLEGLSGEMDDFDVVPPNMSPDSETRVGKSIGETLKMVEDNEWDNISFDVDLWNLLNATP